MNESVAVFLAVSAGASVLVAVGIQEPLRRRKSPSTKPYNWGFFTANTSILLGVAGLIALTALVFRSPSSSLAEPSNIFGLLWYAAFVVAGVGILYRRRWAWILRICLLPEIVSLIVNILYYQRRRNEFSIELSENVSGKCVDAPAQIDRSLQQREKIEVASGAISSVPDAVPSPLKGMSATRSGSKPPLGVAALAVGGIAGLLLLLLVYVLGVASAQKPDIWDNDSLGTLSLGFLTNSLILANLGAVVLAAISLLRGESPRKFALSGGAISLVTLCLLGSAFAIGLSDLHPASGENREPNDGSTMSATGTGFFVTADGYLITCRHVVEGAKRIQVATSNGFQPAKVIAMHDRLDIALLKTDARETPLPLYKASELKLGQALATLGYPNVDVQGLEPKFAKGHVASLSGPLDDPAYLQLSMALASGFSGAPVVDGFGNVVGVATMLLDQKLAANVVYATKGELVFLFVLTAARDMQLDLNLPRPFSKPDGIDVAKKLQQSTTMVVADGLDD
jgi:hypothetical protein